MQIVRTETETGGPQRTRREEIVPVFTEGALVEPDMLGDISESGSWKLDSGLIVWPVQLEAMRQFVAAAEQLDSMAAGEQAGGGDEKGGIYTAFFNHTLVRIGSGDDGGDLNTANFDRKTRGLAPGGGTKIMPACAYLDKHYLGEFAKDKDKDTGAVIPVSQRPARARAVFTDGAMKDWQEFGNRLAENHSDLWPAEHWFVAILGEGDDHDATLGLYQQIAAKHPNVHVYSFDQVANPAEIAEDMAIAVLGRKA